jgi:hypothetical protein
MCWRYEIYQLGDKFRIRAELCNHIKSLIMSCIMSGFSEAVRKKINYESKRHNDGKFSQETQGRA